MNQTIERARRWLLSVPPAVSGSGGHAHTYYVANRIIHGFGLGANDAIGLLAEWNRTCLPPWTQRELNHKVEQAIQRASEYSLPIGHMMSEESGAATVSSQPVPHVTVVPPSGRAVQPHVRRSSPARPSAPLKQTPLPEPLPDQCRTLLTAAFAEGEGISITEATMQDEGDRAVPAGSGVVLTREEWLKKLDARDGDPNRIWSSSDNPGAFIRINPLRIGGKSDNDVTAFRHALIEFDSCSIEEQWHIIQSSGLPVTAVIHSGGKSLHAWVRVDAADRVEYASRVKLLMDEFGKYGADEKNKNPSRFSRLAGMRRGTSHQSLLAVNIGCGSWIEWQAKQDGVGTHEFRIKDLLEFDPDNDPNSMLGRRWLCKGHSCLLVGASGIGKSTLTMQLVVQWAAGLSPFGVRPVKPLKMLVIQAENDIGDLCEQFRGAASDPIMPRTAESAKILQDNIVFVRDTVHTGREFVERLQTLIDLHRPDMVWIDPLMSYIGDDISDQRVASSFLRNWLGPLLEASGVVLMVVHHVRKPSANDSKSPVDMQYLAAGSSELVNWARAVVLLESPAENQYRLRFLKRGSRAGSVDHEGNPSQTIWVQRGETSQTWTACAPPPQPELSTESKPKVRVKPPARQKLEWDQEHYLNTISGRWCSYQEMVNEMASRYTLTMDAAKQAWTKMKLHLSVKTPQESGRQYNTYTHIK